MNLLSVLTTIAFCSYLYIGFYVFFINTISLTNRLFLLICLSFAVWSFGYIFIYNNTDFEKNIIWYKIAFTGASLYIIFAINFSLSLSGLYEKIKKKKLFFIITCILPCIILYKNITECAVIRDYPFGLWFVLWMANGYLYNITHCIILYRWGKKSNKIRVKKQTKFILTVSLLAIFFASLSDTVLVSFNIPSVTPGIVLIWLFGIGYAVVKYKFMSITTELVSKNIIESINESIILLDENHKIITLNKKTEDLINTTQKRIKDQTISAIICEYDLLKKEIGCLYKREYSDFSCRINYQKEDGQKILMDTNFSAIKDKFNDIIGILIIGHEVKEIKQLKSYYKITDREAEVIQHIINGNTYKEIGDKLRITDRTIKAHISNIYNKLGVDNKAQFFAFLKDFNLIPEQKAEKVVIIDY